MKKSKVIALVVAAVAVLAFDVWFFFGGDSEEADDSYVAEEYEDYEYADDEYEDDGELDEWDDPGELASAEEDAAHTNRWLDWAREHAAAKRRPLIGSIRRSLMTQAIAATTPVLPDDEPAARPDGAVAVILWHPDSPSALIDGKVVHIGDSVDGYVVSRIEPERVILTEPGRPDSERILPLSRPALAQDAAPESEEEVEL